MIRASQELVEKIYSDSFDYNIEFFFYHTLEDTFNSSTTPFLAMDKQFIKEGGIIIESTVCSEDEFPIGKCRMRKLTLNMIGDWRDSEWQLIDFVGSWVMVHFGRQVDGFFGRFMIDSQEYDGDDLVLVGYDPFCLLDAPFTGVAAPTNAYDLLRAIEQMVGWTGQEGLFIISESEEQDLRSVTYSSVPQGGDMTCREVVEYVLQTLGCNLYEYVSSYYKEQTGFITDYPQLSTISSITPTDEYTAEVDNYDLFRYVYSLDISHQDIEVSGVTVVYNDPSAVQLVNTVTRDITPQSTLPNFKIRIEGNPLISTSAEATACANRVLGYYGGTKYRKANFTHLEDPRLIAGDMGKILDDGEYHDIILAHTKYQIQNRQQSYCGAPDTHRNKTQGYSTRTSTVNEAYNYSKVHSDANATNIAKLQTGLANVGARLTTSLSAAVSVPHSTATDLLSLTLPTGRWLVIGAVNAVGGASGSGGTYRRIILGTSAGAANWGYVQAASPTAGNTCIQIVNFAILNSPTTVHLGYVQGSGGNITVNASTTWLTAIRFQ